jgi:glutaminyl-tRNA synthetase
MSSTREDPSVEDLEKKFAEIGLSGKSLAEATKSKLIRGSLNRVIDETPDELPADPSIAALLLALATATQKGTYELRPKVIKEIIAGRIDNARQIEGKHSCEKANAAAVEYLKIHDSEKLWVDSDFEAACGIGVNVTEGELRNMVETYISTNKDEIMDSRYKAVPPALKYFAANPLTKWADPKARADIVNEKFSALLGPKDERDTAPVKKVISLSLQINFQEKAKPKPKSNADASTELAGSQTAQEIMSHLFTEGWLANLHKVGGNPQTRPELLKEHLEATHGKVHTRFPPEPNGYLHIGHAKAITVNFGYAKHNGGYCYLRYDDTNPEAEEEQYFTSILDCIEWLGFEPYKVTYSSDHFQRLYDLGEELIKRDKGYVCHCSGMLLISTF